MMTRLLIAVASLALNGCAALMVPVSEDVYHWQKTREALPYTEHVIPQDAVQAYCGYSYPQADSAGDSSEAEKPKSAHARVGFATACAYWDGQQCWIFASTTRLMDMNREHEVKHCQGWDHQVI